MWLNSNNRKMKDFTRKLSKIQRDEEIATNPNSNSVDSTIPSVRIKLLDIATNSTTAIKEKGRSRGGDHKRGAQDHTEINEPKRALQRSTKGECGLEAKIFSLFLSLYSLSF